VKEETVKKFLLIITKKGKIKQLPLANLQKVSKSGKKLINLYQKVIEKCSPHQVQSEQHKSNNHICSITCPEAKELRQQIKECSDCQER
jgi:dTDP-4-amino-4,6-dideoxygalactose transaminase